MTFRPLWLNPRTYVDVGDGRECDRIRGGYWTVQIESMFYASPCRAFASLMHAIMGEAMGLWRYLGCVRWEAVEIR